MNLLYMRFNVLFRRSINLPLPSFDLGGFQIDKGKDHLAWLESLAHFSEVDFTYFFSVDDKKTDIKLTNWFNHLLGASLYVKLSHAFGVNKENTRIMSDKREKMERP